MYSAYDGAVVPPERLPVCVSVLVMTFRLAGRIITNITPSYNVTHLRNVSRSLEKGATACFPTIVFLRSNRRLIYDWSVETPPYMKCMEIVFLGLLHKLRRMRFRE